MRLYGKLFVWFLAAYLLSVAVTFLVLMPLWRSLQPGNDIQEQAEQAYQLLMVEGEPALLKWIKKQRRETHHYGLFIDPQGQRVPAMAPALPRPFRHHLKSLQHERDHIRLPHGGRLDAADIVDEQGQTWRWIALTPPNREPPYLLFALRVLIGVLVLALMAWWVSRRLARPMAQLQAASQQLATGDLDSRVPLPLTKRGDELGELASSFNSMAERLQALLLGHRRLLRDVSHELRSPLSRLQVAVELARQDPQPVLLDRIAREGERLEQMIADVLTLSRLDHPESEPEKRDISLVDLLMNLVDDARFEADVRQIEIRFAAPDSCQIVGDSELLRRAIENVLRNAIHYSANGGTIDVSLIRADSWVQVLVADRGPGVDENELAQLFRPFHRVSQARDRETGGYGLGLAIAAKAVQRHDGEITAANRQGGGLEVSIRLPADAN